LLNFLANFGEGGLMRILGILLMLHEHTRNDLGQVVSNNIAFDARYLSIYPPFHIMAPDDYSRSSKSIAAPIRPFLLVWIAPSSLSVSLITLAIRMSGARARSTLSISAPMGDK
jgi:hypothetical protein